MTGRSQTRAKHCRGDVGGGREGVKTTENKMHWPRWLYPCNGIVVNIICTQELLILIHNQV
jgi:hypothetical protein